MEANVKWTGGMAFSAEQDGHVIALDADETVGGRDGGPRPKTLMLTALGGCTGMDVISILRKMQVHPDSFEVQTEADLTEEHPKVFAKVHLRYVFKGEGLPMEKLQRAVSLSQDKYCGVSAMLAKVCPVTFEIVVNP